MTTTLASYSEIALISPAYAALFGLIYVFLSFQVIRIRMRLKIGLGDGKDRQLTRAIRVHGNFSEYVPLTLLLIFFVEVLSKNVFIIHILSISLLVARISHIYGVSQIKENIKFRMFSLFITGAVITISSLFIFACYL